METYDDEREIGGHLYRVRLLPFRQSRPITNELSHDISAAIRELGAGVKGLSAAEIMKMDVSVMTDALAALLDRIDDKRLARYAKAFGNMSAVQTDGDKWPPLTEQFQDAHFAGAPFRFMKWLAFAIEVNNADFFAVWRDQLEPALAAAKEKAASLSTSPSGSTGNSGESLEPSS